ncbi:copper resistance CopC family protein [Metabacillus schmidteae]|uniref:copper resistance CopC family protein n=1 Tax=Metabacillus schmidteae TaxID=2730405 RepID=UPI00158EBB64|nr:copper resistance CopC family protein [Metabacillus schmidteae]
MKKFLLLICILWMFPLMVSAHTTLSNSNPKEGQVVTEELTELKVEFAGEIEKQSTLVLTQDDQEITIDSITVNEDEIIGTVSTPLSNGKYVLTWKIAAKDGHAMTGDIPFTVEIQKTEEAHTDTDNKEVTESETLEKAPENATEQEVNQTEEPQDSEESLNENSNTSTFATVSVIVLIVFLAGGIWVIFRKKR